MHRLAVLLTFAFVVVVVFTFGSGSVAGADPVECALDEISAVTGLDPRNDKNVDGVRVVVSGAVPADIGRLVRDAVAELMTAAGPVRTVVEPIATGVIVTVRGVTGELPPELGGALDQATGCLTTNPTAEEDPAAAERASTECRITSVLPVDAEGEVTSIVSEIEGAVVGVTGPLPVDLGSTVADVFTQVGAAGSDVAVQVIEGADGGQAQVEGVVGPLPANLSTELATALGCTETETTEPAPAEESGDGSTDGSGGDNDPSGDAQSDAEADTQVASGSVGVDADVSGAAAGDQRISSLARTGSEDAPLYGAGAVLAIAGLVVRRFLSGAA